MKPGSCLVLALISLATLGSAGLAQPAPMNPPAKVADDVLQSNGASLNAALREIAQALATTLEEAQIRRMVKQEVGKKFDGDYDVLYREIADHKIGSARTFRQALGSAVGRVQKRAGKLASGKGGLDTLDDNASALPQLQVSIPVGFKAWDVENTAPLVAFVPVDIDDDDLREIEAFDANGRRYLLDAQAEPDFPVVVVGLNERTDRNGHLRREFVQPTSRNQATEVLVAPGEDRSPISSVAASYACDTRAHAHGDQEFLREIKINNDHEPWIKGSPEIYASYSFVDNQGIRGQFFMGGVNDEGRWYPINGALFYWQSHYGHTFVMSIWEQDGSNYGTFTFNFFGLNYTVTINDGDDPLGAAPVSFQDPNCGYYSTGDAEFKMQYVCTGCACASCGNGLCETPCGESSSTCPGDCPVCGNGLCQLGENSSNCCTDCAALCGNGWCETSCGESSSTCSYDCPVCGNGWCENGESNFNCPQDCGSCGNYSCDPGEDYSSCPTDCCPPGQICPVF